MPKRPNDKFDYRTYMNAYIKAKVKYKNINFSVDKPEDMELLDWIESQPMPASRYIKQLVQEDMGKRRNT